MPKSTPSLPIGGFKASETLLGIETFSSFISCFSFFSFKASETLLGIETICPYYLGKTRGCFKASETLLGIETFSAIALILF